MYWNALPLAARVYVAVVVVCGAAAFAGSVPRTLPNPALFLTLLVSACLMSAWKVTLPIPVTNGSTLSVSYAANLMSLLLLGPQPAVMIAAAGALTQCTFRPKHPYPLHRTIFSVATGTYTMAATGAIYTLLGGATLPPGGMTPIDGLALARPLVGAVAMYFVVNTCLVAGAIAWSTDRTFLRVWREDFLWSASSFMVAGTAGAVAAVVVARGDHWIAVLLIAPIFLTYRTYQVFVGRLEDEHRHTLEIAAARASAEEANRIKDEFLAVVSHELRTPLNAILGWADMLHRGTIGEAMRGRAYRAIHESAKRQAQLVEDLLDVSRIAAGKLRLQRTIVDFNAVVVDALQIVQPAADAKEIGLTLEADPMTGDVDGDASRLQQVVWNLLSNAVKFTPAGGSVRVALRQTGNAAELTISDSGQGISGEFLPRVFDPFRQADATSTRAHSGLGLGLSIVRSLIEAHGGTVGAQSAGEGQGATFTVRLPTVLAHDRTVAAAYPPMPAPPDADAGAVLDNVAVLVVDDDAASREVVSAHLLQRRARVLIAASVAEALDVLQSHHVDVLLADIGMPGEDGYSLVRRVRASTSVRIASIPAVALTALARPDDKQQALKAGFQLHLAKPIDPRALVSAIATLNRHRLLPFA